MSESSVLYRFWITQNIELNWLEGERRSRGGRRSGLWRKNNSFASMIFLLYSSFSPFLSPIIHLWFQSFGFKVLVSSFLIFQFPNFQLLYISNFQLFIFQTSNYFFFQSNLLTSLFFKFSNYLFIHLF